jgi:hypothetical protein
VTAGLGHLPSCASNGTHALALFHEIGPEVMTSDWLMTARTAFSASIAVAL